MRIWPSGSGDSFAAVRPLGSGLALFGAGHLRRQCVCLRRRRVRRQPPRRWPAGRAAALLLHHFAHYANAENGSGGRNKLAIQRPRGIGMPNNISIALTSSPATQCITSLPTNLMTRTTRLPAACMRVPPQQPSSHASWKCRRLVSVNLASLCSTCPHAPQLLGHRRSPATVSASGWIDFGRR
jgi:hypothetical protein